MDGSNSTDRSHSEFPATMILQPSFGEHQMEIRPESTQRHAPWNKGKVIGQKTPLKLKEIWAIRFRLQESHRLRELALFNLAIDSKLRGCDLVRLKINDIAQAGRIMSRAMVVQRKTGQPVKFEITEQTRDAMAAWMTKAQLGRSDYLFPSRLANSPHLSTRQYPRMVSLWVSHIGLDSSAYGTHSLRTRAKITSYSTKA
jgi:site-specific recombinase XerD